jgi:hypothetical protein
MPRDSGPSNPFIPAFCHSWDVASVTNIPPDRFSIGAFKEQVVVIFLLAWLMGLVNVSQLLDLFFLSMKSFIVSLLVQEG